MNQQIFDFLDVYASIPSPNYAIILRGKWGCGKTFFIKNWLQYFNKKMERPADENSIELRPIYVSLFGMSTIKDIKLAIDRCVNPFFYTKTGKFIKKAVRIVSKIAFKTEFDFNQDGKDETSFSGTLDSLSLFESDNEKDVKGVKFLIFDDLERSQIPVKQFLGFANYFVEHCDCHVVIIGEEDYLKKETHTELLEFKEKIVGREFEITPDINGALNTFIGLPMMETDFLKSEIGIIKQTFLCTHYNNLRLLRLSLLDFSLLLSSIPQNLKEGNHLYLRSLLCNYIASYAEYRHRDNFNFFIDWSESYTEAMFGQSDDETDKIRGLIRKYHKVDSINEFEALNPELTKMIVRHIKSGENLSSKFIEILKDKYKNLSALDKLGSYWDKSNDEFDECYRNLVDELLNGDIKDPVNIGKALAFLANFDSKGFKRIDSELLGNLSLCLKKLASSYRTLGDLNKCSYQFTQGYNFVRGFDRGKAITKSIVDSFYEEVNCLKNTIPDDMQIVLRTLSDANVEKLIEIDNSAYPDQRTMYRMRPILNKENPKMLCDSLCSMSNKGRNIFSNFLSCHYDNPAIANYAYLQPDLSVLIELKNMLAEVAKTKVCIEKWSYDNLLEILEKVIGLCSGEEESVKE